MALLISGPFHAVTQFEVQNIVRVVEEPAVVIHFIAGFVLLLELECPLLRFPFRLFLAHPLFGDIQGAFSDFLAVMIAAGTYRDSV